MQKFITFLCKKCNINKTIMFHLYRKTENQILYITDNQARKCMKGPSNKLKPVTSVAYESAE